MTLLAGKSLDSTKLFAKGGTERRKSGIDLKIGKMFDEKGTDLGADHVLQPREMVFVVSQDVFHLPPNVTGVVSCKTSLTHKGIWAITVGTVDPCWVGPVSTSLVNFGAHAQMLNVGDAFLRVAFFKHEGDEQHIEGDADIEARAYMLDAKKMAVRFPKTFLNQADVARRAGESAWGKMRSGALVWGGVLALFFAMLQVGSVAIDRYFFSADLVVPYKERIEELERRIERLEATGSADVQER